MKIALQLSVADCKKAIKELEKYQKQIKPKLDEICKRLAELGALAANEKYAEASGDSSWTGNGDVKAVVLPLEGGNGYKIRAEGHDVYFIEFGTGDMAGVFYEGDTSGVSVPVGPGTWSIDHAQKYSEYGYWWYRKNMLFETPAYMPMYYAQKAIRENEKRIAQEVFGK